MEREKIQRICAEWTDNTSELAGIITKLWMVYDLPDSSGLAKAPWIYLQLNHKKLKGDPHRRGKLVCDVLSLMETDYSSDEIERYLTFFKNFPENCSLFGIGTQTSRSIHPIRLYTFIPDYETMISFLRSYHWEGDLQDLESKLSPFRKNKGIYGLCADIGDTIHSRIGIEYHFFGDNIETESKYLTDTLCELNLSSRAKADAYNSWIGQFHERMNINFWSWPKGPYLWGKKEIEDILIWRRGYIKLVYDTGQPLEAKAYLGYYRMLFEAGLPGL